MKSPILNLKSLGLGALLGVLLISVLGATLTTITTENIKSLTAHGDIGTNQVVGVTNGTARLFTVSSGGGGAGGIAANAGTGFNNIFTNANMQGPTTNNGVLQMLTGNNPMMRFSNDVTSGLGQFAADTLSVIISGSERVRFGSTMLVAGISNSAGLTNFGALQVIGAQTNVSTLDVAGAVTAYAGIIAKGTAGGAAGSLLLNASNQVNSAELTANPSSVSNSTTYLPQTALPGVLYTVTVSGNTNRMTNAVLGSAGQALFSTGTGASFSNLPSSSGFAALEVQINDVRVGLQTNVNHLVTANLLHYATNNTASNKVDLLMDTVQGIQTGSTPQFLRLGLGLPAGTLDSLTVGNTNQAGFSNYLAGFALNLTNTFAAPTNTHQDIGLRLFGSTYLTGSGFGVATPVGELIWSPTIGAPPAAGTWVFQSRTNISGVPTTNMTVSSAGVITAAGTASLANGSYGASATVVSTGGYFWGSGKGDIESPANGVYALMNAARTDAYGLQFGGGAQSNGIIRMISSSTGNSNAVWELRSGNTNQYGILAVGELRATNSISLTNGALIVGPNGAAITNILSASATLDFPSTAAGGVSDLPITVTGAADGDVVKLGVPSGSITAITGDYFAWASNNAVYVRFANNNLVSAQDPASGTFKVIVTKF